jgi:hypothetical protein
VVVDGKWTTSLQPEDKVHPVLPPTVAVMIVYVHLPIICLDTRKFDVWDWDMW